MNEIDPTQPVHPLRVTKMYPVPPVCHAFWTEADWEKTAVNVTEPEFLDDPMMGRWKACGRTKDDTLLYSKES